MYGNDKLYFVVSKCCLMLCEQFFSYIMARWDDNDVRFVLDQHG